jgi:hypothetical protein
LFIPPAATVYVNVIVRPVCEALTTEVGVVSVPDPSSAFTVTLGEAARLPSVPPDVDFCCACHVCAPVVEVAVAPGPPPAVEPYVTVNVLPAARVRDDTVIV